MPAYFTLQELRTVVADPSKTLDIAQPLEEAVDVSEYRSLAVQVRTARFVNPIGNNFLYLEHSPILDETAFTQVWGTPFDLTLPTEVKIVKDLLRYMRWRVVLQSAAGGKTVSFLIDVIARET